MADIKLRVNGIEYGGWKRARVTRGIESIAGGFELEVTDRWGEKEPWPIYEGDSCTLLIGNRVVVSGYVDKRTLSYTGDEHTLSVSGRDKAGDLVDCSAVLGKWEFKSIPLLTLAKRLAEPFGLSVTMDSEIDPKAISLKTGKRGSITSAGGAGKHGGLGLPKPPKKFSVDPGDSAFEVLDRACRMAGVLPVSDGAGGILLTRAGSTRAATDLIEGENILAASADYDCSARYHTYIVAGQRQGSDEEYGPTVAAVKAEATDQNVKRTARVLYIRPEGNATPESAAVRAAWEAKVRAARADSVTVTVQGWLQGNGELWPVNVLVGVKSRRIGVKGDLLITQAVYSVDDGGTRTQLTLKRPDAFLPEPTVPVGGSGGAWKEIARGV